MQIEPELIRWGTSALVSGAAAFGVVKERMSKFIMKSEHAEICKAQEKLRLETERELFRQQREMYGMICEIHGYLKRQNGGNLSSL